MFCGYSILCVIILRGNSGPQCLVFHQIIWFLAIGSENRNSWSGIHAAPLTTRNPGILYFYCLIITRNVLFNDPFNTLYWWLYCVGHMVTDHSEKENPQPKLQGRSTGRVVHNTGCVKQGVEHLLDREVAKWVFQEGATSHSRNSNKP